MKKLQFILFTCFLLVFCRSLFMRNNSVKPRKVQTIFAEIGTDSEGSSYQHLVLAEGYEQGCRLDSMEFANIIKNYCDTVSVNLRPVGSITFYNSLKYFRFDEHAQYYQKEIDKCCLFLVAFGNNKQPRRYFNFYNKDGEIDLISKNWIKCPQ